jgi:hypothetical protein
MRKTTLAVCCLLATCSLFAQNDSSRLDAGSLVLNRNFTQHISIKGEDLEKMPFSNLSDAINVWLNGYYTISHNLIFVVDGNVAVDVNAYSIHDIEEVVLIQNAGALAGTAGNQQQMVLITTRQGRSGSGFRGAAQTFLVHEPRATTNLYHQYFVGMDKSFDKFKVGVSANYLRDVNPMNKVDGLQTTPYHMDRWRLNGYFNWRPDAKNAVDVHVGFVPETLDSAENFAPHTAGAFVLKVDNHAHERDQLFTSWARWRGEWLPGLRNDLQVGYLHFSQKGNSHWLEQFDPPNDGYNTYSTANEDSKSYQLYIRDRVSYALHAGDWSFEPSVNASYQYFKEGYTSTYYSETGPNAGSNPGGGLGNPSTATYSPGGFKLYVLSPVLDISYRQVLNIQGGIVSNVSHRNASQGQTLPRTVAFGSIGIDLLKLDGAQRSNSLKLFGSYSRRSAYTATGYYLNDIDLNNPLTATGLPSFSVITYNWNGTTPILIPTTVSIPKYWIWEAGAKWSVLQNRLELEYNFERRNFSGLYYDAAGGFIELIFTSITSSQHRLGVSYRIVDHGDLSWRMGVNTTVLRNKNDRADPNIVGDSYPGNGKPSFTGGWVNRVQIHRLSVGLDILYHFSGEVYNPWDGNAYTLAGKENSWLLQNVYVGYKLPMHHKMGLEVYVDSRGLTRGGNTTYDMNPRRYYGVGGKIGI